MTRKNRFRVLAALVAFLTAGISLLLAGPGVSPSIAGLPGRAYLAPTGSTNLGGSLPSPGTTYGS
jgi:hypothetical protein